MRVYIETIENVTFEADVADQRWNGWLCPSFKKPEALRLMAKWNDLGEDGFGCRYAARYDEKRDAFGFYMADDGGCRESIDPDSNPDNWEWFERCEDGTYAIGAWCWCWWPAVECESTAEGHKYDGVLTDSETVDGHNWRCATCGLVVAAPEPTGDGHTRWGAGWVRIHKDSEPEPTAVAFEKTVESALVDFWAAIAKAHPHITTGDFPPDADHDFARAAEDAVRTWLRWNDPNRKES